MSRRIKTDLMCALGFSSPNADTAMGMYIEQALTPEEDEAMEYLLNNNPFRMQEVKPDKLKPLVFPDFYIDVFNKLNLRISNGS